ncbi:carbohydrate binding family 9 domain-containing protein [Candidatus Poribacteria bacterium]|nr:carbohydrate binding family 9 domain-containing protein [Candidatus Poribacteria bacterium]MYG06996.1 carbohydrate binding family 9 domain-containing protein [Candidatus Poribacteria bacterium]MYK21094.1 carbohydrate binding family 9 domain-containing protein [Candidatus Poribacteria bacterium]
MDYLCRWLSMLLLFFISVSIHAETEELQAEAYRTYESVEIDGELTESDWQNATPIRQFIQFEPDAGAPLTEATEVRILYDDKYIYFGFVCSEPDRSKIVANKMRRDTMLWDNDNVFVLLDTYNDRRSGFFFRVNPLGAREDVAIMDSGDSRNENWNAVWNSKGKINGDNWTTEIAIPFSQLRFKKEDTLTWGLNLGRTIQKNQEEGTWAPVPAAYTFQARYRTTHLGELTGLSEISQRRNIEVLPYLLPGIARTEADGTVGVLDLGGDVKVSLTSNLTADLTVNTDFAQVEADREQANLTRFSLFFPEKRQFFLEGAGLFDFGIPRTSFNAPPPLLLFYSRRIGIEEGHAIPILTGGKVTGKVGGFGIGALNVFTDKYAADATENLDAVDVDRTNYSVLRIKRDLFTGSSLGVIGINKQGADAYNRATGIDFIYRPTDKMNFRGLWARTFEPSENQDDLINDHASPGNNISSNETPIGNTNALYFGGNWQSAVARVNASYTDIGEDFNPEVGYVYRTGSRWFRGELRGTPYLHWYGLRRMWIGPELDIVLNSENQLETRTFIWSTWLELETNGWGGLRIYRNFENLAEDFEIREGIIIPKGEYTYNNYSLILNAEGNVFNGRVGFNIGNFYNGTRRGFDIRLDLRLTGRFSLEPRYEFNRVTLPEGTFDTNVFGGRVGYSFSTDLFTKLYVQWNSDRNLITTNFLINYIYQPGSDFYLVFNQTYGTDSMTSGLLDTTLVGKVTYWWNP